jgi:hypothetical protein
MTDQSVIVKGQSPPPCAAVTFCPWQRHSLPAAKLCYADNERNKSDQPIIDDFNANLKLTHTQTVMEGASHCDFRFTKKS